MKTITINDDIFGENFVLRSALRSYIKTNKVMIKNLKKIYGNDNRSRIHKENIRHCKTILSKLK